jgi:hypothetical protein
MWACGSDDDGVPGGGGGSGGSSGKGTTAGAGGHSAGTAGKAQGGGAGKTQGGGTNGGSSSAGQAGDDGVAGVGGDSAGGSAGDSSEGGSGGEAGASTGAPTLIDNCTTVCATQAALTCTYGATCAQSCVATGDTATGTAAPVEYAAMIACMAKELAATNYECSTQSDTKVFPAPKAATACETKICAWTCADATLVDENIYARCGC